MGVYSTYQIAIKEKTGWTREYVCAADRYTAVCELIASNKGFDLDRLDSADEVEVESCF